MTTSARKRNRPEDWEDVEPSPVVHVGELPEHTLEIDLIKVFEEFGSIKDLTMIPQRGQALVEFADIHSAGNAVMRCSKEPLFLGSHRIRVNYSTSKRIFQRQTTDGYRDGADSSGESRVLLITVYNAQYPITVDVIHQIASAHGRVLRIVIFQKAHIQAMVEFKDAEEARTAKQHLNGADIYSGCCTLKIEFARPTRLTVFKNDQETWDFENPLMLEDRSRNRPGEGRANVSLLGRFNRQSDRYDSSRPSNGDDYAYPNGYPRSGGPMPLAHSGGTILDQMALSLYPSLAGLSTVENSVSGRASTLVVMVYNMNLAQMNCDRLFNLLCLYGNVMRIKFLRTKEGSAMAQLGDSVSVDRAIRFLSGLPLLGNQLLIRPSKQMVIMDVLKPFELPDGTPSFKDYTWFRENRYTSMEKVAKNRIYAPSNTLHYWNCPPDFSSQDLCQVFVDAGSVPPVRVAEFPSHTERSSSGLVEWDNLEDATAALTFTNHYSIPYPKGRFPFIMKLSFSNAPIQDRTHPHSRKVAGQPVKKTMNSPTEARYLQ